LTPKLGPMNAHLWINDGLMAIFFLIVGLEIIRELVDGRLPNSKQRRLPFMSAQCDFLRAELLRLRQAALIRRND
jgi:NhaA family Na+:H+ antiporter